MVRLTGKGVWSIALVGLLLAGCGSTPPAPDGRPHSVNPVKEPPSATGNPRSYVVFGKRYHVSGTSRGYRERGLASWYGPQFHGRNTSSGTPFDMYAISAAHKSLPIPTYVRVTHLGNGRSLVVRVDDRGPFVEGRVIDLSYAAAVELDMVEDGTAPVEVVALPPYQFLPDFDPEWNEPRLADNQSQAPAARIASSESSPLANPKPSYSLPQPPTFLATTNTSLYLQVGAFTNRYNAERLRQRLAGIVRDNVHIDTRIERLYKVWIGPFSDPLGAEQVKIQLAGLGLTAHAVIFE